MPWRMTRAVPEPSVLRTIRACLVWSSRLSRRYSKPHRYERPPFAPANCVGRDRGPGCGRRKLARRGHLIPTLHHRSVIGRSH
jgi:hypothetical protein